MLPHRSCQEWTSDGTSRLNEWFLFRAFNKTKGLLRYRNVLTFVANFQDTSGSVVLQPQTQLNAAALTLSIESHLFSNKRHSC